MRISMKTNKTALRRLLPLLALMFVIGAFLFAGAATAYAADISLETLSVDEVWLTGDTLHITVTDKDSGESQSLELNLSEYAKPGDEYVTVQATDSDGRTSNAIQFKNPYYIPQSDINSGDGGSPAQNGGTSESAIPGGGNPFTPDGTGTVVDNATDGDGKEFFTVKTPDGNVFYLIVDRQRNSDNVYLLNAVTEDDLASLAKPGDGKSTSAIETPTQQVTPPASTDATPEPTTPAAPANNGGSNNSGTIAFVVIAVIVVGGAGYYFKIIRPKKLGTVGDDDYGDEPEDGESFDDEELDVGGEGDDDE